MNKQNYQKLKTKERLEKTCAFLKALRMEQKMTLPEISRELGVSPDSVSRYERGERYPSFEALYYYIKLFHVSFQEIAAGKRL